MGEIYLISVVKEVMKKQANEHFSQSFSERFAPRINNLLAESSDTHGR
jgi:hypothetical protein